MKRFTIALAAVAGLSLFAGRASADPGGYSPPGGAAGGASFGPIGGPGTLIGAGDLPPGQAPDCYGWTPSIKKFFGKFKGGKGCSDCGGLGHGGLGGFGGHGGRGGSGGSGPNWGAAGYGVGGPAYNPNGPMMQGTLVFPHHTFARSPRDYFMLDLNK